ncbi:MAG: DMT family transporter [Eggerthellaceae bacterium]|nr:DMT family transporter [Eggerthellaceae bacterium]
MGSQGLGYMLAVAQAILYASMGVFAKFLYNTGLNPQQVTIMRFVPAAVLLAIVIVVLRKGKVFSRTPMVYVQGIFFAASAYLYMLTVDELTAGLTTVVFYSYPAVVAILAVLVFHERFTLRTLLALVLALAGIVFISGILSADTIQLSPLGLVYGIGSCLAFAVYSLLGQATVKKEGQLTISFTMSAISSLIMLVLYPAQFPTLLQMDAMQWIICIVMAILCTALPIPMLLAAIKRIGATKASLIGISETPFSLLLAFLVLGEVLTAFQGIGSALIVASIVVTTLPSGKGSSGDGGAAGGDGAADGVGRDDCR